MTAQDKAARQRVIREYNKRVDFHRAIHRDLDDGALIALCESYRDEGPEETP
ncbi:MAG: hypothetical protein SCH98_12430 [Deferrisomatales bacterium]|nr:hypothetical protein [Deferrisomatales bacterium]